MSTNDGTFFLGRQPIVDRDALVIGYELLYRDIGGSASQMKNKHYATANVLTHTLSLSGIDSIIGEHLAFVNIDGKFLQHDMILSVPKERFIFELDASITLEEKNLERLEELYLQGYSFTFCIDDVEDATAQSAKKVSKYITYIKLNTLEVTQDKLMKILFSLGSSNKRLIASHIENKDLFESFSSMGFELFQGYFFAKPEIIKSTQVSTDAHSIMSICNLLTTDASTDEITQAFTQAPSIVLQLIQYMNSCAFSLQGSIGSIDRVITLLGRKALSQWLYLTLYASEEKVSKDNALLLTIKQRTQLLVDILQAVKPDSTKAELAQASFMGLLSAIDVIFNQPLDVLFERLHIDDTIKEALLSKKGLLGEIYEVSIAIEQFDLAKTEEFIRQHDIPAASLQKLLFRSIEAASDFKPTT